MGTAKAGADEFVLRAAKKEKSRSMRFAGRATRTRADLPLLLLDAVLCLGSYLAILLMRFDGIVKPHHWRQFWTFVPIAVVLHLVSNAVHRLYGPIWEHASVAEARRILTAGTSVIVALLLAGFVFGQLAPMSVIILGGWVATMLMGALRFQSRLFALRRVDSRSIHRVAVLGAGEAGASIVREMLRDPQGGLQPVVILDDSARKRGRSIQGIPIAGGIDDLAALAQQFGVTQAVLAIPSADRELTRRSSAAAAAADVPLKVLPSVSELVRASASICDVRDLRIEDLLGRDQVKTDLDAVEGLLAGRRVLITGAGGSIGSEIVRQVAACRPSQVLALDHDETHLYEAVQGLPALSPPVQVVQVLADIRNLGDVTRIFAMYQPEVVFHAAAHKHVPILENHACEAAGTNVLGTMNVLSTAARAGVKHLVVISTDKAVRPSSVMGASKWMSEQLMMRYAPEGAQYCAVRFGNVLGSRGSVIPTFARQIGAGGPVTVTDSTMTRYFMSIQEAVQLVLQAAALASGRDLFMLDMGEPVNIYELAQRMITLAGHEPGAGIPIAITGMRPGEKLAEELRAPGESADPTSHPSILRVRPVPVPGAVLDLAVERLAACVRVRRHDDAAQLFRDLTVEYAEAEPSAEEKQLLLHYTP